MISFSLPPFPGRRNASDSRNLLLGSLANDSIRIRLDLVGSSSPSPRGRPDERGTGKRVDRGALRARGSFSLVPEILVYGISSGDNGVPLSTDGRGALVECWGRGRKHSSGREDKGKNSLGELHDGRFLKV